ncbi:MAG: hypothetical protein LBI84_10290, partial [Propionibacteriaceae bacterium]|nr:hypothetical protein [Propionibacteriaceae bacterium]
MADTSWLAGVRRLGRARAWKRLGKAAPKRGVSSSPTRRARRTAAVAALCAVLSAGALTASALSQGQASTRLPDLASGALSVTAGEASWSADGAVGGPWDCIDLGCSGAVTVSAPLTVVAAGHNLRVALRPSGLDFAAPATAKWHLEKGAVRVPAQPADDPLLDGAAALELPAGFLDGQPFELAVAIQLDAAGSWTDPAVAGPSAVSRLTTEVLQVRCGDGFAQDCPGDLTAQGWS